MTGIKKMRGIRIPMVLSQKEILSDKRWPPIQLLFFVEMCDIIYLRHMQH